MLVAAAVLLSIAVYAVTLRFGFVYDDQPQILENRAVQSHQFQASFFTQHLWVEQNPEWKGNYYRPLFLLWLQANYLVFGSSAFWWHAGNLLVHAVATLLVYFLGCRLVPERTLAAVAAMLFAVHPVHAEAVAWISGVDESLACVFFLASLLCWMKARDPGKHQKLWIGFSVVSFAAAVLMKENAVVLPAVVIAFEWLLGAGWRAGFHRSLPFWLVAFLYFAARTYALSGLAHPGAGWPLWSMLLTMPSLLWFYAVRAVWPFGCSALYDLHLISSPTFAGVLIPLLQVIGLTGIAVVLGRASRVVGFLLVGAVLSLLPFLAAVYVFRDYELVHDRYLYTPSAFLVVLAAFGLSLAAERRPNWALRVGTAAVVATFSVGSVFAALPWKDNVALFSHAMAVAPHNPLARSYLAEDLVRRGRPDLALPLYQEALALDPQLWPATLALGSTHLLLGHFADAERVFKHAIETYPPTREPNGLQFYLLGMAQNRLGKFPEAEKNLRTAISIHPHYTQYHYELALALKGQGRVAEARAALRTELSIFPGSQQARQLLEQLGP